MKVIPLRDDAAAKFKSKDVIKSVLENSPTKALTIADMRIRDKILDKLEAVTGENGTKADVLLLEDEHHRHLKEASQAFPWAIVDKSLLRILEDIDAPKEHLASVEKTA